MNGEFTTRNYLREDHGKYIPVMKIVQPLGNEVLEIKRRITEFRNKQKETFDYLQKTV